MGRFKLSIKNSVEKGFTLIELLVVISIIAVLLSVLMPALNAAKEKARSLTCLTHLKQFNLANMIYVDEYNGYNVPGWSWFENFEFMEMLGMSVDEIAYNRNPQPSGWWMELPERLICPSSKVARYGLREHPIYGSTCPESLGTTYMINLGNISTTWKYLNVRSQSDKILFTCGSDYVTNGAHDPYTLPDDGINYKLHWDIVGDLYDPWTSPKHHGMVTYRHSEGASIAFYDGHTERRKKQEIWVEDENGSSDNPAMVRMWDLRF